MESLRQVIQNKLTESESKCQKLEADNVELYTKIKYLQSNQSLDYHSFNQVIQLFNLTFLRISNKVYEYKIKIKQRNGRSTHNDIEMNLKNNYENKMNPLAIVS